MPTCPTNRHKKTGGFSTSPEVAAALRGFLRWAVSTEGGNAAKYLEVVGFIPLPTFIRALSENQIDLIKAPSQSQ
jgi:hypothetical protein